jgi:hypothetical protein
MCEFISRISQLPMDDHNYPAADVHLDAIPLFLSSEVEDSGVIYLGALLRHVCLSLWTRSNDVYEVSC